VRATANALVATAALLAAGCGGNGDKTSDQKQVTKAVTDYAHAFGRGDGAKACSLLTPSARAAFVKRISTLVGTDDCAEAVEKLQGVAGPTVTGPFERATVNSVQVDGDKATANLVAAGHPEQINLERSDDRWRLTKAPGT
jgi:hypothetical protein